MYTKFHCPGIKVQPPPGELIEFFYKRLHFNGPRDNPTKSNNTLNNKDISYVKRLKKETTNLILDLLTLLELEF